MLPSGRQATMANRTHWAIAYLHKAGLIERKARGQYEATERGRTVLTTSPERITIGYLGQFPGFSEFRAGVAEKPVTSIESADDSRTQVEQTITPEERLDLAYRDLSTETAATLLGQVAPCPRPALNNC